MASLHCGPLMAIDEHRCRAASLFKCKVEKSSEKLRRGPEKLLFGAVSVSETRAVQVDSRLIPIKSKSIRSAWCLEGQQKKIRFV